MSDGLGIYETGPAGQSAPPIPLGRVSAAVVEQLTARLRVAGVSEAAVAELRAAWPDVRFTYCSDDDIASNAKPVAESDAFAIYLVNGSQRCLSLTNDYDLAVGVVVAERYED